MSKTSSSQLHRFLLDLALIIVALTAFFTGEAGTRSRDSSLHQVLAVSIAAGVLVHLAWQWRWIVGTTRRFSSRPGRVRLNYVVGAFLLVTFVATYYSGLMISSWVSALPDRELVDLHHVAPKLFVLGVVVHTLLHWRWVVDTVRKLGGAKPPGRHLQFAGGAGEARGPESEAPGDFR
jgi:hypothetical protein